MGAYERIKGRAHELNASGHGLFASSDIAFAEEIDAINKKLSELSRNAERMDKGRDAE